jgi:uncharacterized protein (TIGR02996 family)
MTTDEGFLQAILDDVEDDALRLVYADWLEEHGQPERAEFIRVQVELARLDLTMNLIGEAGRKALRERFGDRVQLEQQREQC